LHAEGQRFDSVSLHKNKKKIRQTVLSKSNESC
jgi:hypothetical protein